MLVRETNYMRISMLAQGRQRRDGYTPRSRHKWSNSTARQGKEVKMIYGKEVTMIYDRGELVTQVEKLDSTSEAYIHPPREYGGGGGEPSEGEDVLVATVMFGDGFWVYGAHAVVREREMTCAPPPTDGFGGEW
ncbi:hypothetical protein ACFE04_001969 [Oxalis oulophora]